VTDVSLACPVARRSAAAGAWDPAGNGSAQTEGSIELLGAVDLGGTYLRTALVDCRGQLTHRSRVRVRPREETTQLADAVRALISGRAVRRVIIGMPGRVDRLAGRLEQARNLPSSWIAGLNARVLAEQAGCEVVLAGDAELAAIGEVYFGAGTRTGDTAYLTLSTGVGTAALSAGRLLAGHRVGFQIGFIRPDGPGHPLLDTLASGQQLTALARAMGREELTVQELIELADAGDARARQTWDRILRYAAWAALALCHTCNPDILVIGGGLATAGDRLLVPLTAAVRDKLADSSGLVVGVRRSLLGDDAGLAGAGAFAAATASLPGLAPA
jgi:glucokinase